MNKSVFGFQGNESLAQSIAKYVNAETGEFIIRKFPDGETYVRVLSNVKNKEILIVCSLDEIDSKVLPLLFLCNLLRDMKVKSICLIAPYLAYMRQDKQFNPGEAVSSDYFAGLLSSLADRLITIDPHLHRRVSLKEIYTIPCEVLHASLLISEWIKNNVEEALLIGPDSESEQWVSEIARYAEAPFIILEKTRLGDHKVKVSVPNMEKFRNHTPVLVDDIISTAGTMIETLNHLKYAGMKPPVCIGVHPLFSGNSYNELIKSGAGAIVTCNTIPHSSNRIDISYLIANCIRKL